MAADIQLIVGLGNPGPEYERTRHNAGFWFIDAIADGVPFKAESKFRGQVAKVNLGGRDVWLLKPDTYMNRSGQSVAALAHFYKIPAENILIAHDELDLDPGVVRLKQGGGHGGHNGLRDIVSHLGGNGFLRLRIGIGHPGSAREVVDYVLARPSNADRESIEDGIEAARAVLPQVLAGESQRAMNQLHSR